MSIKKTLEDFDKKFFDSGDDEGNNILYSMTDDIRIKVSQDIKQFLKSEIEKALNEVSKIDAGQVISIDDKHNTFADGYDFRNKQIKSNISNYIKE